MILQNSGINGFLVSLKKTASGFKEYFLSGFAGYGWKIWQRNPEKYCLEIDELVVRNTMTVFELLIGKIRALKGSLVISQANGKIREVAEDNTNYYITLEEEECSFVPEDFIRCQTFTGGLKSYWVKVSQVAAGVITVPKTEFDGDAPAPGDEIVQFGNATDTSRQSAIYLHADEGSEPAIDILKGIRTKSFDDCIKVRLGGEGNALTSINGLIKALTDSGEIIYQLSPDGSVNLGKGAIIYNPATDKLTLGNNVVLTWSNLSSDAKENLKGEKGDKGEPGQNGTDGIPGTPGRDGVTYYTWVAYSDYPDGRSLYQIPNENTKYIGIAVNKTTPSESNNPAEYTWSKFKGETGENGLPGAKGDKGDKGDPGVPGRDGQDANLLDWVRDWNDQGVTINNESIASPKMFCGLHNKDTGISTGIAIGRDCITINGVKRSGIFGVVNNAPVFILDPLRGQYEFSGKITSDSGRIGGFEIDQGSLKATDPESNQEMLLSGNLIRFTNPVNENQVYIGTNVFPASTGGAISSPIRIEVKRQADGNIYGNVGAYIQVTGSTPYDDTDGQYTGNHAFYIKQGDICGFRLRTRRIKTSQTLSEMDSNIFVIADTPITLTLPRYPEDGQVYHIKSIGSAANTVTLTCGNSAHRINDGRCNRRTSWSWKEGVVVTVIFDAIYKLWHGGYSACN